MVDRRIPFTGDLISYGIIVLISTFFIFTISITTNIEQITAHGSSEEDSELTDQGSETDNEESDDGDNGDDGEDGDNQQDSDGVDTSTEPGSAPRNDNAAPPRTTTPAEREDQNGDNGDDGEDGDNQQDSDGVDTSTEPGSAPRNDNAAPPRTTTPAEREDQGSDTDEEGGEGRTTTTTTTAQSSDRDIGRIFRSTIDGFQVQIPEGWIIQEMNNTDSVLLTESTQEYEVLAQLCLEEGEQRQAAFSNVSGGGNIYGDCEGSQKNIVDIVRYLELEARLQAINNITTINNNNNMTIDNILLYHMQRLEDVGYSGIQIVNTRETKVNVINGQTNQTVATAPAKLIEYTYLYPGEEVQTRIMYREYALLVLNEDEDTGYALLYKGPASLLPSSGRPSPPQVQQIFDSFELLRATIAER